jgi:hypothetical protein
VTEVAEAYRIISADDHMDMAVLPPDLWRERLPIGLKDRAPTVVETPDGLCWSAEGRILGPSGLSKLDPVIRRRVLWDTAARIYGPLVACWRAHFVSVRVAWRQRSRLTGYW